MTQAFAECICASDNSCSAGDCGPGFTTNCTRTRFTVDFNANYTLYATVTCTGSGTCSKCMACVSLFYIDGGSEVELTDLHNNGCNVGQCTSGNQSVSMSTAKTYVMYVCKVLCPDNVSVCGSNCVTSCTAYACLNFGLPPCSP